MATSTEQMCICFEDINTGRQIDLVTSDWHNFEVGERYNVEMYLGDNTREDGYSTAIVRSIRPYTPWDEFADAKDSLFTELAKPFVKILDWMIGLFSNKGE